MTFDNYDSHKLKTHLAQAPLGKEAGGNKGRPRRNFGGRPVVGTDENVILFEPEYRFRRNAP
jgi:hypothetical protein